MSDQTNTNVAALAAFARESCLDGVAASPGVAVGPALLYHTSLDPAPLLSDHQNTSCPSVAEARKRLRDALVEGAAELRSLAEQVRQRVGAQEAAIFESQALMLEDPTIEEQAARLIGADAQPAAALIQAVEEQAALLETLPDPLWRARAADVRDAARVPLRILDPQNAQRQTLGQYLAAVDHAVIVVTDDLAPSDTAHMGPDSVLGIALTHGSATSHAAILARALGIPAVVGLGDTLFARARTDHVIIVDGSYGQVNVQPTDDEVTAAADSMRARQASAATQSQHFAHWRLAAGKTRDDIGIPVMANVGSVTDAGIAASFGAEGIGLLRTEFLLSGYSRWPSEAEQTDLYCAVLDAFSRDMAQRQPGSSARRPVIIRLLDAGADKPLPALASYLPQGSAEANPALGMRGIRLSLSARELLTTQISAILRATARTRAPIHIMAPMIATIEELQQTRDAMRAARMSLIREGIHLQHAIPLGVMVETPAAVFACAELAREAAFFSIGANDLTQYVMAADRLNPRLTLLCQPLQPAVTRAIASVASCAARLGRVVGVCGEMASDPQLALLLVGLGARELSMTPHSIPVVKEALARYTLAETQVAARLIQSAPTLTEAQARLQESFPA